jgi:single-stranded-DNA-specific exonuclease
VVRALGEEELFWTRVERELARDPTLGGTGAAQLAPALGGASARAPRPPADVCDRRGEGVAGVVGDLLTSGEPVLVAVVHLARRRESLERLLAGIAPFDVASWDALLATPALAGGHAHLVAFDPPPVPVTDVPGACVLHLAWGPAELEFALAVWRSELELRPALVDVFRALRAAGSLAGDELRQALVGAGRYARSPEVCGRLLRVLGELDLVEYVDAAAGGPRCRARDGRRTELERSIAYRGYRGRLERARRAHASPAPAPAVAVASSA